MRSVGSFVGGLLPVVLVGCAFVSSGELTELKKELDADGDGTLAEQDCDDLDPTRRPVEGVVPEPDREDIPYNHIDDDCGGPQGLDPLDLVDVDGDGFPGVAFEQYAQEHMEMFGIDDPDLVPWPPNVSKIAVDCVDREDQFPLPEGLSAGDINPSVLQDDPYDGVDQDCSGNNDFDADGDGQMPPTVAGQDIRPLVEAYVAAWNVAIDLNDPDAFADCDDARPDVNRSDRPDASYDGIDTDCDGGNDFDADGDGYYPPEYASQFGAFVALYHPATAPDGPAGWAPVGETRTLPGDCLDQPHPVLTSLDPADVNPSAPDAAYDGVDSDCAGDNDFDGDGDGYILTEDQLDFATYVANWSGTGPGIPSTVNPLIVADGGDCDDTNATVAPGNLELLFDDDDADCDANVNATPFGFSGYTWDTPTWPRVVRTDAHYVIGTTALWADLVVAQRTHAALALLFDPDSGYDAPVSDPLVWNNVGAGTVFEHGAGIDLVGSPDRFWVASSYFQPDPVPGGPNNQVRLLVREHVYQPSSGSYAPQVANRVYPWTGHDAGVDLQIREDADGTDVAWLMACGGAGRLYPSLDPDPGETASFRSFVLNAPVQSNFASQVTRVQGQRETTNRASVCFQEVADDGETALLTSCDHLGCESFDAVLSAGAGSPSTQPVPSVDATWSNFQIREANVNGDLLILVREGTGVVVKDLTQGGPGWDLLTGVDVVSADAGWRDGRLYLAAIVDEGDEATSVRVYHTPQPGVVAPEVIELPLIDDDFDFEHEPVGGCDPAAVGCQFGRNLTAYKIGMHVDDDLSPEDDRLVVAVSARSLDTPVAPADGQGNPYPQDAVGWVFLGFSDTPP